MNDASPQPEKKPVPTRAESKDALVRRHENQYTIGTFLVPVIILALTIAALLIGLHRWQEDYAAIETQGFAAAAGRLETNEAAAIVERIDALLAIETSPGVALQLSAGRINLSDHLLRVFIAPGYLKNQPDDSDFIRDMHQVLQGREPAPQSIAQAEDILRETQSRLGLINAMLQDLEYDGALPIPAQPTRLRTVYVADTLPPAGTEIVGRLVVDSELRLTGTAARMKLYADDQIRANQPIESEDPALLGRHTIEWNSAAELSGDYELSFLVLTDDGRGYWQTLNSYRVPVIIPLDEAKLHKDQMTAQDDVSRWYVLKGFGGEIRLNLVESDQPLQLKLFDEYRNELAATQSHPSYPAALRYRETILTDEERFRDQPFYVRAFPHETAVQTLFDYSLLQSHGVARPLEEPQRVLAVTDVRDDELYVVDESGRSMWRPRDQFEYIDPAARLGSIEFAAVSGEPYDFVPAFSLEDDFFALVVREDTRQLSFDWQPLEGSAAQVSIMQQTQEESVSLTEGNVQLSPSENRITIEVIGFDGEEKTYEVSVLRPPHGGAFDSTLQDFPYGYQTWLWYLHLLQPQYQVQADPTDIDFQEFVDAQAERDRSLVDANHSPNSWVEPGSPVYDGVSWKAAARPVVAHFGDPRNFLDPIHIFQFEKMVFDPQIHTREGVEAMLIDSFMAADNPQDIDYASLLMQAGRQADISPFFLAAKIIQEMGREGQSPLAFGELSGYEGAYNFYNINSIPNPDVPDGARINGARFALYGTNPDQGELSEDEQRWQIPWNTPERGIVGGAIWISERYVTVGQDTLYLQKFDLVGNQGLYMRQYAQNIQMAWAEGRRTYRAYADMELLDQPFIFKIPIFENMPSDPALLP